MLAANFSSCFWLGTSAKVHSLRNQYVVATAPRAVKFKDCTFPSPLETCYILCSSLMQFIGAKPRVTNQTHYSGAPFL